MVLKHPSALFSGVTNPDPYEFRFFSTLSPLVLRDMDGEIRKEVMPFLRRFESLPEKIQKESSIRATSLNLFEYQSALAQGWSSHNSVAKDIDTFLTEVRSTDDSLSLCHIQTLHSLLDQAFAVEHEKRVMSAGVKIILERSIEYVKKKIQLTDEELRLSLTVSVPNFWIVYNARHLEFFLRSLRGAKNAPILGDRLRTDFHGSNELVMHGRIEREFLSSSRSSLKILKAMVSKYKAIDSRLRNRSLEGAYIALERPDLQAIRSIMTYDNFDEYCFGQNLFGIPDLFLRRFAIDLLVKRGLVERRDCVLFYSEEEILKGVKEL